MTRQEMVDILVEDRFWDWIYARNTDGLDEVLRVGWKGFDEYSNKELAEALEEVDVEECKKLIEFRTERGGEDFAEIDI